MPSRETAARPGCPSEAELRGFDQGTLRHAEIDRISAHLEAGCSQCSAVLTRLENGPDAFADELRCAKLGPATELPAAIGRYRIDAEVGRGGMGVVYRAVDPGTGRTVAVKCLPGSPVLDPRAAARFEQEVKALAQVTHPHVVRLYDYCLDGNPIYLVMEFVDGEPLDTKLDRRPLPPREAAALVEKVTRAVHAVHRAGLLHRDLKPGNVLLTRDGEPKVSDFGLARPAGDADGRLTRTGTTVGTPQYMPPEQAQGDGADLTPAGDVYALGAVLYEMLTGRPPFQGPTPLSVIDQVVHTEPVPPTRLQPGVPRDLETICLKCLEKDPARRYPTAGELADDLRRFLDVMPILARPLGPFGLAFRRVRRNKLVSALIVVAVSAVLGGAISSTVRWLAEGAARQEAVLTAYNLTILDADREWLDGRADKAIARLDQCPSHLRGWEWHYLNRRSGAGETLCARQGGPGTLAVTCGGDRVRSVADDGVLREWGIETRRPVGAPWHVCRPFSLTAFDSGAKRVACYSPDPPQIDVWDADSSELIRTIPVPAVPVTTLALSRDGTFVALGDAEGVVSAWAVQSGRACPAYRGHAGEPLSPEHKPSTSIGSVVFTPDGAGLVSCSRSACHLSEVNTGLPLRKFRTTVSCPDREVHSARCIGFLDSEGTRFLTATRVDPRVRESAEILLHDVRSGTTPQLIDHSQRDYHPCAVDPSRGLVAFVLDRQAVVRDISLSREVARLRTTERLVGLAFTPDGRRLVTVERDGAVRVWDIDPQATSTVLRLDDTSRFFGVTAVADGRVVILAVPHDGRGSGECSLCVWDREVGERRFLPLQWNGDTPSDIAASPDGVRVAVGMPDGSVQLWDWRGGRRLAVLTAHSAPVRRVAFTPDGRVVAADRDGRVLLWSGDSPGIAREVYRSRDGFEGFALSPDGLTFAAGGADERGPHVAVGRVATGEVVRKLTTGSRRTPALAFSPDGRRLAVAASAPDSLQVWDWPNGTRVASTSEPHNMSVSFLLFTADGRRVLTGSQDWSIKVWDAARCSELLKLQGHQAAVNRGVMLADGLLFTSSWDGTIRVWDGRPNE